MVDSSQKITIPLVWKDLKRNFVSLFSTDLIFRLIALIALSPIVSLLFRLFLRLSGREVLADTEIALFLIHPLGWLTAIIVGGAFLAVLAFKYAALMSLLLADSRQRKSGVIDIFRFLVRRSADLFRLTSRIIAQALWCVAPFLIVGGGLYLALLTNHDINYYLSEKPPRFWWAVVLIGIDLLAMLIVLLRQIVIWAFAIQLLLFENSSPQRALGISRDRLQGQQARVLMTMGAWAGANLALGFCLAVMILFVAWILDPGRGGSVTMLVVSAILILLITLIGHLISQVVASLSLAIVITHLFLRFANEERLTLPEMDQLTDTSRRRKVRLRFTLGLGIAALLAGFLVVMGFAALDRDIETQVTAHRGASGEAPENTLAAVRLAIEQGTDWVEIDVQETKDGVVVVAHDSDLKKVSGADVKIWEATAEELRQIDIGSYFDPKFHRERVPTLEEVLEVCRGKVGLNIELKYYGHDQNLEQRVVELVEEYGMQDNVKVMSLKLKGIQKIQKLRPDWEVGLLTAVTMSDLTRVDVDFYAVKTTLATPLFIQQAHLRGKEVATWTVNDELTMATMIRRGADSLITDHPALAKDVLQRQQAMTPAETLLFDLALLLGKNPIASSEK
ncbi:MAG: glycerophosphodiester phosphodiesterase [Planctomycetaceae bacterium]|nr:glycerophosphodiester phosphodiesterase [Planctomycetaceae bacterium]